MNELIEKVLNNKSQNIMDYGSFGDTALFGGFIVLIGMATVFSVLILLWAFLVLFKKIFHDIPEARANDQQVVEIVKEVSMAPTVAAPAEGEIVAVIAAAIAMAESESSGMKFKVVSFKRI